MTVRADHVTDQPRSFQDCSFNDSDAEYARTVAFPGFARINGWEHRRQHLSAS